MLLRMEESVRTGAPVAIADSGIYFYGPCSVVGDEGVSRHYRIWFRLVDTAGRPTTAGGHVRIRFVIEDNYFGYLTEKADDDFCGDLPATQARLSDIDGEPVYVLAYPQPVVLMPEWFAKYTLQVWFQAAAGDTVLYRETEGTLDPLT